LRTRTIFSDTFLILAGATALAVMVRLLPSGNVFHGGSVFFYDVDCYVHLRKIMLHVHNFPHFVTFDYYEAYPHGAFLMGSPMMDYLISAFSMLIGLGRPDVSQVETVAALTPVFIGGLTVIAGFYLAKGIFKKEAALIASALLALMYAHVDATVVGRPDNEMLEPLMVTVLALCYMRLQADSGSFKFKDAFIFGIAAFAALSLWRGATLWILLIGLAALIDVSIDIIKGIPHMRRSFETAFAFFFLSVFLSVLCLINPWGNQNTINFSAISWFHAIAFFGLSLGFAAYGYLWEFLLRKGLSRKLYPLFAFFVLCALSGLSILFFKNIVFQENIAGIRELFIWIKYLEQYKPFYGADMSFRETLRYYGWAFPAFPLMALHMALNIPKGNMKREKIFVLFLSAVVFSLTLLSVRFAHVFAVFVSVLSGYTLYSIYGFIRKKAGAKRRAYLPFTATLFTSLLMLFPVIVFLHGFQSKHPGASIKGDARYAMSWLKENTPRPSNPYDMKEKPSYSVLARQDFTGWVEYLAERPSVTTIYGTQTPGFEETARYYLSEDEETANRIMEGLGARYVVLTEMIRHLPMYSEIIGIDKNRYAALLSVTGRKGKFYTPTPAYFGLLQTRLYLADGMQMDFGGAVFKPVERYRLVYESRGSVDIGPFPKEVKRIKIFEHLKGALLKIKTRPGLYVEVSSTVRTNQGRLFDFLRSDVSDEGGEADFVLPYAAAKSPQTTGLIGPYTVKAGSKKFTLDLSEEDLLGGVRVERAVL
jgi:dolichyl-diphosphooligosaccharide--protein glycosyltransferase